MSLHLPEVIVVGAAFVVSSLFLVIPSARICQRLGFSPWLGAVAVIPLANLILLWFVAFSDWPANATRQSDAQTLAGQV